MLRINYLILSLLISGVGLAQVAEKREILTMDAIKSVVDSLAFYNEIHGLYVAGITSKSKSYKLFQKLSTSFELDYLLQLSTHCNPTIRGYVFWALSRSHYGGLDSVLLAHAKDEQRVRVIQGRTIAEVPVIDFMQWVVHPDLLDADSKKLPKTVIDSVSKIRFSKGF